MIKVLSFFIYMALVVSASILVYFTITSIWNTNESGVIFLLSFICCHLLAGNFETIGKRNT